MFITVITVGN